MNVRRCTDCALVFTDPLIQGGEDKVGSSHSSVTDEGYHRNIIELHDHQVSLAHAKVQRLAKHYSERFGVRPSRILELGCGTGQYAAAWSALGATWTGVEASPDMLAFCERQGLTVLPATELPNLPDGGFDLVYFSQVLEHVLEPRPFLQHVARLVRDGGVVHLDVPNHDSTVSVLRRLSPFSKDFGFIQPPHHLIAYTRKSLRTLMESSGFIVEELIAYANNDATFGQLMFAPRLPHRVLMQFDSLVGTGSLLTCLARKRPS